MEYLFLAIRLHATLVFKQFESESILAKLKLSFTGVQWNLSKGLLAVNTVEDVFVMREQVMSAHFCDQVWIFC